MGPQKWIEPSNWKMSVDNCSDNYHLPVTTPFHLALPSGQVRFGQVRPAAWGTRRCSPAGQAPVRQRSQPDDRDPRRGRTLPDPSSATAGVRHALLNERTAIRGASTRRRRIPEEERRLGRFRARRLSLGNHSLFPNTVLGFRLAHTARDRCQSEFWHFVHLVEKDAPEEIKRAQGRPGGTCNGISGR